MSQENKKTSNGVAEPNDHQNSTGPENRPNLDEQPVDGAADATREKNLKLSEDPNMPELKEARNVQQEDVRISLDLGEPTPEVMEYAKREIGETDEVKCQMLQEFRDMIYGNSRLNESELEEIPALLVR